MNYNSLISIIVPVYNAEKYLDKCLNSIINQTYKNLEIILVDDGSVDNSPLMCDEYALKDNRIIVIHQTNQRQAAARNHGIDIATGDYFMFVDSDDYIALDMCEYLLEIAHKFNADIVTCPNASVNLKGNISYKKTPKGPVILNTKDAVASYVGNTFEYCGHSPWNKIYSRDVINDVRFPEGKWFEDLATIYKFVDKAKKIVFVDEAKYYYVEHETSTMKENFSIHTFDKIEAYHEIEQHYKNIYPEFCQQINISKLGAIFHCVGETFKNKKQNELKDKLKWSIDIAKKINTPLSLKRKILKKIMIISPVAFGFLYKHFKQI